MRKFQAAVISTGSLLLFFLTIPDYAYAYLDPGTGTYILQIVMAAVLAGLAGITIYWRKLKSLLKKIIGRDKGNDNN